MDTKLKGDIAVQKAILCGLARGWGVLLPVGDRLPYDLVYDVPHVGLRRIQVKAFWLHEKSGSYYVGTRRSKTNRRHSRHESYGPEDFDFALLVGPSQVFVVPIAEFLRFRSTISFREEKGLVRKARGRQRQFREAWHLITHALHGEASLSYGERTRFDSAACDSGVG